MLLLLLLLLRLLDAVNTLGDAPMMEVAAVCVPVMTLFEGTNPWDGCVVSNAKDTNSGSILEERKEPRIFFVFWLGKYPCGSIL
mmetsp:Transcript_86484/g.129663  ORF Transcript_86484/g.129663 Transcript_86484/m.129663 type:complete len:84 (+) Transcript_86484:396-647(+)